MAGAKAPAGRKISAWERAPPEAHFVTIVITL